MKTENVVKYEKEKQYHYEKKKRNRKSVKSIRKSRKYGKELQK